MKQIRRAEYIYLAQQTAHFLLHAVKQLSMKRLIALSVEMKLRHTGTVLGGNLLMGLIENQSNGKLITKDIDGMTDPKQTSDMITLTKDQIIIFGRPNFGCREMAHLLIKAGLYADGGAKSEYEQAVVIHWTSNLLDKYGDDWRNEATKIFEGLQNDQ